MDFYNDPQKVDEYIKICDEYDGAELYAVLDQHLESGSTLLELGCGPGNDVSYLKDRYHVTASDFSDEFINRGREKFPDVRFLKLDAVSIKTDESFDCVFSNKVLHHLALEDLEKSLQRQQQVIAPGGLFAHTFWLGDKEMTMEGMLFLFHDRDRLIELVSRYFTIKQLYDYQEFEEGDSLFILAQNDMTK